MPLTRRALLRRAALGASALPLVGLGGRASTERKFLFVFVDGGWDVLKVFAPRFDSKNVDMDGYSSPMTVHGLPLVGAESRAPVTRFFEAYGDRCCLIQGMEVRSVAHERCRRILMTGAGEGGNDDWGSILAAHSAQPRTLPYLVMAGYAFSARHSSQVVRVGANNQLPRLLDGTGLPAGISPAPAGLTALADDWLGGRLAAGPDDTMTATYLDALGDLADLEAAHAGGQLALESHSDGCQLDVASDASVVLGCMAQGLTRCGMVMSQGWCNTRWDQHSDLAKQDEHYSDLFDYLAEIMLELDTRTGVSGAPLSEEVTVVVISEMGRHPLINTSGGRDHWTYTTAMLLGSGVRGGQVIGGYDDVLLGRGVDLGSGASVDGGTALVPSHLGATLLALGDVDPGEYLPNHAPIEAVLA